MFKDLINICKGKKVYIQTHNFPDPDAIASSYGLQELFKKYNIDSTICFEGKIDKLSSTKFLSKLDIKMLSKLIGVFFLISLRFFIYTNKKIP